MKDFDSDVDLGGLMASDQQEYEWDYKNNLKHIEKFDFPQLKGKVGLFIIEFVGNGKSARAVINKGKLNLAQRETVAGHLCYILDHSNQICKSDKKTGIIFENKFYEADKSNGRIFVPYGEKKTEGKCILVNEDFAVLTDFTRKTEKYDFYANIFMNDQSAMLGSSAQVLVRPKLTIHGQKVDLKMLKNTEIIIQINDNSHGETA